VNVVMNFQFHKIQGMDLFSFLVGLRTYQYPCIYVFGCKLSVVRLCDSDFGITPVDDITIGITCAAFCFHLAHISLLLCIVIINYYYYRISHFSALAGKYSHILGCSNQQD